MWFRSHPWVVALIGLVLEAVATIPFALLDAPETSAALALLIAAAVAFLVGPRWGALVAAAGWALFFVFVVDHAVRALVALPVWLAAAVLTGLASDRLRRAERERRRDASELDAVRGDENQAIVGLDLEGDILTWDRGAERIYGHTEADVSDADVSLLGTEEDTAHILAALERVAKGERVDRSHLRQRGRNGEELLVSMALIPVRDDRGIVAACAVISDGTERVHEAERRYRALVEALPLVTLISAPNDRSTVTYVSPQVEQMLGYSPTDWQDDPRLFGKLLHPDDKDEVLAGTKRKSSGAAPRKTEYRLLARSGGVVWCARRWRRSAARKASRCTCRRCSWTSASGSGPTRSANGCWPRSATRRPGPWNASGASTSSARPATCCPRRPTIEARFRESPSSPFATTRTGALSTWSRTEAPSSESPSLAPSS
jgi:PAS domain S-box-containing protein